MTQLQRPKLISPKDIKSPMETICRNNRLILALDVADAKNAISIAEETAEYVDAIKIGYPLALGAGLGIINDICEFSPVIADFKIADIPNTGRLICEQAFEAGAGAVIVHGFTGTDSVLECVKTAAKFNGDIFVVTEMSHPGAIEFMQPKALELAAIAVKSGAKGVVAPATRPESIQRIRKVVRKLIIISPGVGAQGASPADAIRAGADYVIAGRSIYNAKNPSIEAEKIVKEIEKCQ